MSQKEIFATTGSKAVAYLFYDFSSRTICLHNPRANILSEINIASRTAAAAAAAAAQCGRNDDIIASVPGRRAVD